MLRRTLLAAVCATSLLNVAFAASADGQKSFSSDAGILTVTPVVEGLDHPWAVAFLPNNQGLLITERPGHLRVVSPEGKLSAPLSGVPQVWAKGQGGLLDVVLSPDFAKDRLVYVSYAEGGEGGTAGTAVGRARLSDDLTELDNFEVIFRQTPKLSTGNHFGSRLAFDRDGYLFIALGENNQRPTSQDPRQITGQNCSHISRWTNPARQSFCGAARRAAGNLVIRSSQSTRCNPQSMDGHALDP